MPGLYAEKDFDLAGFAVGAVERGSILPDREAMTAGDVLIGISSSGLHSNGFSLVRRVVEQSGQSYEAAAPFSGGDKTLGEALLAPTCLYVKSALAALHAGGIKALAHITGGGITENLPRVLLDGIDAEIDLAAWTPPSVFGWLAQSAGIAESEMLRTFNCGIGLIVVSSEKCAGHVIDAFQENGDRATRLGTLVAGGLKPKVQYTGALRL
jgi:phosphoribosylaminoimidazole synthetase